MTKKKALYIGDSSDDDTSVIYSTTKFYKKINEAPPAFVSSFLLEEISHSILHNGRVVENYISKKNKLNNVDDHSNVDRFVLGKYLNNTLSDEDFKNFYYLSKGTIENIQQELLNHLTLFKLEYTKAAIIEDHNYEPLHSFLEKNIGINLKDKLLAYCNKSTSKKLLGLDRNQDYSSLGYDALINALKESVKDTQQTLSAYCKTIFKDELATIKPNTKSAQQFLTEALEFKRNADLVLYSKQIDSIKDFLQNPDKPPNPATKASTTLSKTQKLATKIYIEQLNDQNKLLSNYLEQLRPNKLYLEDGDQESEFLSDFKLDHRILRNKVKTAGISKQGDTITHNVGIKQIQHNPTLYNYQVSETNKIYGSASRSDEVGFAPGEGSYSKITEYLQNSDINGSDLARAIKSVLKTGTAQNFKDEKYIGQLTYLLFRCEPERNASSFLTNAMFLELLENGIYTIEDIPNKMPMAMSEAVDAARSLLDQLGGKYGEDSPYLTKRQYYDFKDGDVNKAQELAARDTLILLDWLNLKTKGTLNLDHDVIASDENYSIKLKYFLTQKDDMREAKSLDNFLKIKGEQNRADKRIDLTKHSSKTILDFTDTLNSFIKEMLNGALEQPKDELMPIDAGSVSDSKPETIEDQIFKAFHNLVYEWYGIRLDWLYSFKQFKEDNKEQFLNEQNLKLIELINTIHRSTGLEALKIILMEDSSSSMDLDKEVKIELYKEMANNSWKIKYPIEWNADLKSNVYNLIKALALVPGDTISLNNTINLLDTMNSNFEKSKYLKDQFEKWASELWNNRAIHLSGKSSNNELPKNKCTNKNPGSSQKADHNNVSEDSRESKALKYWQDKYKHDNDDASIKNLLAASAEYKDTLINILKGEAKIEGISTHVKNFIIQYLDKVSRIDISQLLANKFLNNNNSIELREQLLSKIAEHTGSVNNLKLQPDTQHQDATEFLEPLYSNALGMYKIIINIACKNQDEVDQYRQKPQIEEEPTAIIQLEINKNNKFSQLLASLNKTEDMIGDNKVEFEKIDGNTKVKIDAVKTTKTIIPDNRREICFSIKRFENDLAKINDLIEFDQIKVNEQDYEITAFIRHTGSLKSGHYIAYVKENDGKWYSYNDAQRDEVNSNTLDKAKEDAYVVKYSVKGDPSLLPNKQEGIENDTGARCWLNSSVIFTKSFTTLKENLTQFIQESANISQDPELLKCINPQKPLNIQEGFSSGDIKMKNEYKGISDTKEGLNLESIKLNLANIIISNLNNIDFYIAPNLISEEELILKFNNWKMTTSSHYGALIGIEDQFGSKHAILLHASRTKGNLIKITLTDPLAEQDSVFKAEIKKLAHSLQEEEMNAEIVYSGRQDKDYGTCADISLIMLQELIEQFANSAHSIKSAQVIDNNLTIPPITLNCDYSLEIHNFDYDNIQLEAAGGVPFVLSDYTIN